MEIDPLPVFPYTEKRLELARLLVARLERLSADSRWAHRASGYRGALLDALDEQEDLQTKGDPTAETQGQERLVLLMKAGFDMLEKAAREIIS